MQADVGQAEVQLGQALCSQPMAQFMMLFTCITNVALDIFVTQYNKKGGLVITRPPVVRVPGAVYQLDMLPRQLTLQPPVAPLGQ